MKRYLLPLLAVLLCVAAFAPITLQPSNAQTASGAGAWQPVPTGSQLGVMVDITAASGTVVFDAWLQGTNDSADANGYDVPADQVLLDSGGTAATGTLTGPIRDIVDNKTTTTAVRAVAVYTDDVDFCWRAKQAGFSVRAFPEAISGHWQYCDVGGVWTAARARALAEV